jgi:hypothetical protein
LAVSLTGQYSFKRILKFALLTIGLLLVVQITTYNLISVGLLEDRLLGEEFNPVTYSEETLDSAFVRDFIVLECGNVIGKYYSHNLVEKQEKLKSKLKVKVIEFQDPSDYVWASKRTKNYKLSYLTWVYRYDPWSIHGTFRTSQVEELHINGNKHTRQITYTWVLFFWIKSCEHNESIYRLT